MFTWFGLTIASVFFLVSYYFLSKRLFNNHDEVDPRFYGSALQFMTGVVALPIALISGFQFHFTMTSLILLILMAASYTIGPSLYYIALKNMDLSKLTILESAGIFWSVILGFIVLGELITPFKIIGVVLIALAVLIISYKSLKRLLVFSKYEVFLICSTFFYVLGATLDNKLVNFSTAESYMAVSFLLAGTLMFLTNIGRLKNEGIKTFSNKTFQKTIVVNAVFIYLTYLCILKAYQLGGEVSRMYPIQQVQIILVPLLSIFILKEKEKINFKIVAAIIAFIGILIIKI